MKFSLKKIFILCLLLISAIVISYFYLPVNRIGISSELIMLGDLNNDNQWNELDRTELKQLLENPFLSTPLTQLKADIDKNGVINHEDLQLINHITRYSDPYVAEQTAKQNGVLFPRPRELFRYLPTYEYIQRPLILLPWDSEKKTPFLFLQELNIDQNIPSYDKQLLHEIYNEALRFSFAFEKRKDQLSEMELDYAQKKMAQCESLFHQKEYYELLLNLISLVEDAETLTTEYQSDFIKKILYFRDDLKKLLASEKYKSFGKGTVSYLEIFKEIENYIKSDLDIFLDLNTLPSPRDFKDLNNYLDRAEWQAFKSKTRTEEFEQLVLFAQYDRRYLRAVSKTTPRLKDLQLQNHNLPMILLYREALRITENDKKSAIGLLDEALRIPMGWVKSIPRELLPSSVALENFLLPGNKEDGSDKSRHWNVFGGVALYKSPEDSLTLALQREIMDLRDQNYTQMAMQEFIRDTIANINGIYYVVSIDPDLMTKAKN